MFGLIKIVTSEVTYQHYLQYLLHSTLATDESYILEMKKLSFPQTSSFLGFNQEFFFTPRLDLCLKDIRVLCLGGWFAQYRKRRFAPVPGDRCFPCAVAVPGRVAHSKDCARHTFIYLLIKEGSMLLVRSVITEHPNVCLFSFMRDPGSVIDCH